MSSGYDQGRAKLHEEMVSRTVDWLRSRGYEAKALPVQDHGPDVRIDDSSKPGDVTFIYVKTKTPDARFFRVTHDSMIAARDLEAQGHRVAWLLADEGSDPDTWLVQTLDDVMRHAIPEALPPDGVGESWPDDEKARLIPARTMLRKRGRIVGPGPVVRSPSDAELKKMLQAMAPCARCGAKRSVGEMFFIVKDVPESGVAPKFACPRCAGSWGRPKPRH